MRRYINKKTKNKKPAFYAVREGHQTGIFMDWEKCKSCIEHYNKPIYKKFDTKQAAQLFIEGKDYDYEGLNKFIGELNINTYNPDEDYDIEKWTKRDKEYYIFADGSGKPIKETNQMKTQFAIYFGEHCKNVVQREYNSTNNRCEALAIKYVLDQIVKNKKTFKEYMNVDDDNEYKCTGITIVSDSEYCVKACDGRIFDWQKRGWKTLEGKDLLNQDIFKPIVLSLNKLKLHGIKVNFVHQPSHRPAPLGDDYRMFLWIGNRIVDILAQDY